MGYSFPKLSLSVSATKCGERFSKTQAARQENGLAVKVVLDLQDIIVRCSYNAVQAE
jgi:hypothetical protein